MSHIIHEVILVTSYSKEYIEKAQEMAFQIVGNDGVDNYPHDSIDITEIFISPVNAYYTFAILPDGSKEGWDTARKYDRARAKYLSWLKQESTKEEDGIYCEYVMVSYGTSEYGDNIVGVRQ